MIHNINFTRLIYPQLAHNNVVYSCGNFLPSVVVPSCMENTMNGTEGHNGEVFASKLAGDFDFLTQCPAIFGLSMVRSSRGMMTHLLTE